MDRKLRLPFSWHQIRSAFLLFFSFPLCFIRFVKFFLVTSFSAAHPDQSWRIRTHRKTWGNLQIFRGKSQKKAAPKFRVLQEAQWSPCFHSLNTMVRRIKNSEWFSRNENLLALWWSFFSHPILISTRKGAVGVNFFGTIIARKWSVCHFADRI